jgi:hypothetical protein
MEMNSRFAFSSQFHEWRAIIYALSVAAMANVLSHGQSNKRTFEFVEKSELFKLAVSSSWLPYLISSVENLPVSFTLATASADRPNFPIIYVNKGFEAITGLFRMDMLSLSITYVSCNRL